MCISYTNQLQVRYDSMKKLQKPNLRETPRQVGLPIPHGAEQAHKINLSVYEGVRPSLYLALFAGSD